MACIYSLPVIKTDEFVPGTKSLVALSIEACYKSFEITGTVECDVLVSREFKTDESMVMQVIE